MRVAFTSTPSTLKTLFKDALSERTVLWKIEDIDFDDDRREEVISYIGERYGEDRVTEVITFDRYKLKSSVRNLGRIFGLKPTEQDAVADKIEQVEEEEGADTMEEALEVSPDLRQRRQEDERFDRICKRADALQGLARHPGRHPAAVIVTPGEMTDYVPTRTMKSGGEDHTVTHFDGDQLEDIGLLKIDVLGLAALNEIDTALEMAQDLGHDITEEDLDGRDDPAVYENIFAEGDTRGIFQFESGGMRQFLAEMEPTEFVHIAAMNALYRPGPMEQIPSFIDRMHGEEETIYIDRSIHDQIKEDVADVLDDTYGIMVFQEQVMQVCRRLAGFDLGEADIMRRAIGKKKEKLLMEQKQKFVQGCIDQGYGRELGETIFQKIEEFADYAFNRCVTKDTKVVDASSGRRISVGDIVEGREKDVSVFALDESNQKLVESKVTDAFQSGKRMTYRLQTRTGRNIQATANHPFYTQDGWKKLEDLSADDRIAIPRELNPSANNDLEDHELVVLAHAIADGEVSRSTGFYVYAGDERMRADFKRHVRRFPNTATTTDFSGNDSRSSAPSMYVKRRNTNQVAGADKMIDDLGLRGCTATEKFVPDEVFACSDESVALFLGRLWAGDGCVTVEDTFYATSSYELAEDVQHLLLRLGIKSRLHEKTFNYRGGTRDGYTVRVTNQDMRRFADVLGPHLVGKRKEDLKSRVEAEEDITNRRGTQDIIPQSVHPVMRRAVVNDAEENDTTLKATMEKAGVCEKLIRPSVGKRECRKGFGRSTVRSIAEATDDDELRRWANSDIYWDEIESVEKAGVEEVYDLTVEDHHNFVAEDIIVHNSHSSCYAALAYKQAYLKHYCPAAFYAAAVQAEGDDDKRAALIRDLSERGVEVKRPSINESKASFAATSDNVVRFGLSTIKNVGKQAGVFLEEREKGGPFESFMECLCRCTPNARAVKSLIKAGAFDDFDLSRATMMENHDKVLTYARKRRDYRQGSRKSMPDAPQVHEVGEFPRKSRFRQEREVAVTYTTGAPTDEVEWLARHLSGHEHVHKGTRYRLELATILEVRDATTSTGNRMWWVTYRTADGEVPDSAAMWDSTYEAISEHLEPDTPVVLVLETDVAGDYAGSYTVENAVPARQIPARLGQVACVETDSPQAARRALERLSQLPEGEMRA